MGGPPEPNTGPQHTGSQRNEANSINKDRLFLYHSLPILLAVFVIIAGVLHRFNMDLQQYGTITDALPHTIEHALPIGMVGVAFFAAALNMILGYYHSRRKAKERD